MKPKSNPKKWIRYYSRKRIPHQWMQLDLLSRIDAKRILEVGPAMGAVTAMLENSGYEVTTLDYMEQQFDYPKVPNIERNLLDVTPAEIRGYDAIICCETLEHLPWDKVAKILDTLYQSEAKYLLTSVPYMGFQITFDIYLNAKTSRTYFSMKKLLNLRDFVPEPEFGHQWEVGYRQYSLKKWEAKITAAGYKIIDREFSEHCRSVFHLLSR
jgi:phospholipid N-methyltransferase